MHMHVHVCIHVCVCINGYLSACTCVYMCTCMHMYVYLHFAIPSPHIKVGLLGFAPPPPPPPLRILKSFLRLCYMYSIARNPICEYWDITSSQHTIGLSGHHRPASETNILMEFRWWADSGPIYMGLVARIHV